MISKNQPFTFVHLGKTGGSSVISALKNNGFNFEVVHIQKVIFDASKKYVLLIRDPIERFISAFNWRYYLLIDADRRKWNKNTKTASKNELELLLKYKTPNLLAENIQNFNFDKDYIHHINENYEFYFHDFLSKFNKNSIYGVMRTESLQSDFESLFGIKDLLPNEKQNISYNKQLSKTAFCNLLTFLEKDYIVYKSLLNIREIQ